MDHGQQEPLGQKPFAELARQLERRPLLGAALARQLGDEAVTHEVGGAIITTTPEEDRQPPPAGPLGRAVRRVAGEYTPEFRARMMRELMQAATCPVCHERACAQTHEVVFEGFSYWCGDCGYCEPDSTHDGCSGTLRRVRVTARVDEPS